MSSLTGVFNKASKGVNPAGVDPLGKENKGLSGDFGALSPRNKKDFKHPRPPMNIGILPDGPATAPEKPLPQDIRLLRPAKVRKRTAEERGKKDISLLKPARVRRRKRRGGSGGGEGGPGGG